MNLKNLKTVGQLAVSWSLAAVTSFAAIVSTMVLVLRRGVW
jgi:hypothetical protein